MSEVVPTPPGLFSLAEIQTIIDGHPHWFAGIYLDGTSDTVHVNLVHGAPAEALDQLRAAKRPAEAEPQLTGPTAQDIAIRVVPYSTADLNLVLWKLIVDEPWSSRIKDIRASWGIDIRSNKARLGLTHVPPELRHDVESFFGAKVKLVAEERARTLTNITPLPSVRSARPPQPT
jgi:hypothetical protein